MSLLLNLGVLVLIVAGTWWLTGRDRTLDGRSKRTHYATRTLRCLLVLIPAAILLVLMHDPRGGFGLGIAFVLAIWIGFVLRSSVANLISEQVLGVMDPMMQGGRHPDLKKGKRYRDSIAELIRSGKRDEAIKLCERLKQSGEVDLVSLEQTLEFLGVPQMTVTHATRLRTAKKFDVAAQVLHSVLLRDPANFAAGTMLMRIYALDLRQPVRAQAVLQAMRKQPMIAQHRLESAQRLLDEWSRAERPPAPPPAPASPATPASVDELLAAGYYGSAVEILEQQIALEPRDFELRLRLAEIQGVHCCDFPRAEKTIQQLEREQFSKPQVDMARARLAAWKSEAGNKALGGK